jgi:hypothetical protein
MSQDKQKPPAYQWYPKDYESDEAVRLMTYEQEGIYRRLLDHQRAPWQHPVRHVADCASRAEGAARAVSETVADDRDEVPGRCR